jgi:hypothetical protein
VCDIVGIGDGGIDGDADPFDGNIPFEIEGRPSHEEKHKHTGDRGIRVTCGLHGPSCRKFRSLNRDVGKYGPRAAFCFLGAWLQKSGTMDGHKKKQNDPSTAEVRAYIQQL